MGNAWSGNPLGAGSTPLHESSHASPPESGAALFEFALLMPILVLLILGIIEFGWLFAQMNEIRHVAQEGARWGAVSRPDIDSSGSEDWGDLATRACNAANLPGGTVVVITGNNGGGAVGDTATVSVSATTQSLSNLGLINAFLPASLANTATFRLEQPAAWSGGTTTC